MMVLEGEVLVMWIISEGGLLSPGSFQKWINPCQSLPVPRLHASNVEYPQVKALVASTQTPGKLLITQLIRGTGLPACSSNANLKGNPG